MSSKNFWLIVRIISCAYRFDTEIVLAFTKKTESKTIAFQHLDKKNR